MAQLSRPPLAILAFHKPAGVVVTASDELGRRTVYDVLPSWVREQGFDPIGRLDLDTRGLLLFAQDGKILERLARPGALPKVYEVFVRGRIGAEHVRAMTQGVSTAIGLLRADAVELAGGFGTKSRLRVTLREGKNRHIRRMIAALARPTGERPFKVTDLKRTRIGSQALDIPSGAWRWLEETEVRALLAPLTPST